MSALLEGLTLATALGCGVVAGVWFTFSAFVMRALARLPSAQGIAAMQSINVLAVTPPLMIAMFGTALACLGLGIRALVNLDEPAAPWVLAGAALYLLGAVAVTMTANVPRNNALAALDPGAAGADAQWAAYTREWTAWNHVRGAATLAAAALLTVALVVE